MSHRDVELDFARRERIGFGINIAKKFTPTNCLGRFSDVGGRRKKVVNVPWA